MEKKIKSVKLKKIQLQKWDMNDNAYSLPLGNNMRSIFTVEELKKSPDVFEIEYEEPERVKKVFEVEYDKSNDYEITESSLEESMRRNNILNPSVKELNCSKQELIEKIINYREDCLDPDITFISDVIDIINSHYIPNGWNDEDMIEFAMLWHNGERLSAHVDCALGDFKKLKNKK